MTNVSNFLRNPAILGAGIGGLAIGGALGAGAMAAAKRKKSRKGRKRARRVARSPKKRRGNRRSGRRTPRTAGRGKDTSHKRIRYTKNGQPYIIMASGKARFIKKSGAKRSHKQRGGRY